MCRCSMEREGTACLNLIQQTEGLTRVVVIPQTEKSGSHGTSAVQQRRAASKGKREAGGGWVVAGVLSDEDEQRFRHLVYAVRTVSRDGRMREQANSHWRCWVRTSAAQKNPPATTTTTCQFVSTAGTRSLQGPDGPVDGLTWASHDTRAD